MEQVILADRTALSMPPEKLFISLHFIFSLGKTFFFSLSLYSINIVDIEKSLTVDVHSHSTNTDPVWTDSMVYSNTHYTTFSILIGICEDNLKPLVNLTKKIYNNTRLNIFK